MASFNKVILAGNLTKDPEIKYIASGMAVANLDLAINSTYSSKAGEKKEETVFVNIVVWGRQAETASQYLSKGSPILVDGRLQFDTWETPQGEKRSRLRVLAQRIQFLGSGKKEAGSGGEFSGNREGQFAPSQSSSSSSHAYGASSDMPHFSEEDDDIPF